MAVKKANTKATKEVAVEVEIDETVETVEQEEIETVVEETTGVEVEIPEVEEPKVDVEVDKESVKVKESDRAEGKVKIRMRVDHKCCIAMERYDLKAGKTYTVPENVKRILNNAGLLAPL